MSQSIEQMYRWWQRGVIYQIYPRSFMDSNGDGVGDLQGILSKLDYLCWLGVDALWLSPIYPSPMADFGYDIEDYTAIHSLFGSLADFDQLLAAVHQKGMRLLLDLVPNHTSDQHPWFAESRGSRNNPKRDWYLWRDPVADGGPPNNWLSNFGGSAWTFDDRTGQYYYHAYLDRQPDLNWRNPAVQAAMLAVMRFWLDRGVDGFRIDVIWHLIKDEFFRDNPVNPNYQAGDWPYRQLQPVYTTDQPEVHDVITRMRELLDEYPERMMVGEIYLPVERLVTYYGASGQGAHLPFNFQLIELPWHARLIGNAVDRYEALLPAHGWPNWVLGNHDKHRIATRIGTAQARVAAMLLLTLRGTPTLYYGDEIGMHDVPIPPDRVQDPWEINTPGLGLGRDPERTPMQWSGEPNAGFSQVEPWLPVAADAAELNVETAHRDADSLLCLYRRLLALRRREPALAVGSYACERVDDALFAYRRSYGERALLVILNFTPEPQPWRAESGRVCISTHPGRDGMTFDAGFIVEPNEGLVIELGPA